MAKHPKFKWKKFGADVKRFRCDLKVGLREVALQQRIHHATWCRAEQGKPVTVPIFLRLCEWMVRNPYEYATDR